MTTVLRIHVINIALAIAIGVASVLIARWLGITMPDFYYLILGFGLSFLLPAFSLVYIKKDN